MKILICTQVVDKNDTVLGFFHRWVEEFSKKFEKVTVVCLKKGLFSLPSNVEVLSLGKEDKRSQIVYIFRFLKYVWYKRDNYDSVFVHMNQEYVLIGGWLWKILGKKVFMWRNHPNGNLLTRVAVMFADKVFCTSPKSFTAKFKKTQLMPVGIDTDFFNPDSAVYRTPNSVLFLGRISPIKKVLEFVEWFNTLDNNFLATIVGEPLHQDAGYYEEVKRRANNRIMFQGAVNQNGALKLYQSHEVYVNKTPDGSFDKTIMEAAACETKVLVDNTDLKFMETMTGEELREFVVQNHNLKLLMDKLEKEII